ncbi:hypothetical protein Lal_00049932 [Lupinus albus]|uniref:Putative transcription factor MYB-HB-like family n=1 Tax=Lupinus albus TaxID=3870 RepID=A0A6A5M5Y4_LUPAL|nr:putative transcription factor MYB-HB-like family [Lupinus albus]KAF1867503.1 hypothetical protein Lal_00049932 [Lupinus albus]
MASSSPSHMLLKSFVDQNSDHTYKLQDFLSRLEEEQLKIDAFKRELPLCMQLLTNAMEASRQQLQVCRVNQGTSAVLEEFIPIKHSTSESSSAEKKTTLTDNKANWMTSAQLWSQASEGTKQQSTIITPSPKETVDNIGFISMSPNIVSDNNNNNKHRNHNGGGGGAFLPFSKERNSPQVSALSVLPELALASVENENEDKKCAEPFQKRENSSNSGSDVMIVDQGKGSSHAQNTATTTTTNQTHRKARRCWSPELHRLFVNALQMLGGSQVATPKQIRELMKVEGLTNDEVKSHLQKYRLHTRRPSPSPQTGAPSQLVVLGGIWVPPEYTTAGAPTLYGTHPISHAPPPHYSVPQEFYNAAPPQQLLQPPQSHNFLHQHHNHEFMHHVYKTAQQMQSSPESNVEGASESIEDGKSESSSWKGESGENEGEMKRVPIEESNGSEITLKF